MQWWLNVVNSGVVAYQQHCACSGGLSAAGVTFDGSMPAVIAVDGGAGGLSAGSKGEQKTRTTD